MTAPAPSRPLASRLLLAFAVLFGTLAAVALVPSARGVNGAVSLPLDDAWIHLTYARTLATTGSFSYAPGEPTTAGSTSPLFTLIEAALFRAVPDEKALALGLSLLFHAAFLVALAAWARRRLRSEAWAAAAVAIVALDPRVGMLAASGMETSLFLLWVALAFHERLAGRARNAGLALGAALWTRPDAVIVALVFALDARLPDRSPAPDRKRPAPAPARGGRFGSPALVAFGVLLLAYVAFHLLIARTPWPATVAAKTAFYRGHSRSGFLANDVLELFDTAGWIALAPFFVVALVREAARLFTGRPGAARAEVGLALGLPLAYLLFLPFGHRFDRYLIPALPAATIAALAGLRTVLDHRRLASLPRLARGALIALVLGPALVIGALAYPGTAAEYARVVRYHLVRHEATGRWLAAHTPATALVATHDVGAIGFYSRRRILDAVGLVSPEVVRSVGTPGYPRFLEQLMNRRGVAYVAAFEEWLPVDDVAPIFTADPEPEVMRVFPWIPGRAHLMDGAAIADAVSASQALGIGDVQRAIPAAERAVRADPRSGRLWTLLGSAYGQANRPEEAERAFRRALTLFPDFGDARDGLVAALVAQGAGILEATDAADSAIARAGGARADSPRAPRRALR